jgi:hypothetical protein
MESQEILIKNLEILHIENSKERKKCKGGEAHEGNCKNLQEKPTGGNTKTSPGDGGGGAR